MCIDNIEEFDLKYTIKKTSLSRRIITAILSGSSDSSDSEIDVLKTLNSFHGPDYNFYGNIGGTSNKLNDILYEYEIEKYKYLILNDLYGDTHIYNLCEKVNIEWTHTYL